MEILRFIIAEVSYKMARHHEKCFKKWVAVFMKNKNNMKKQ